MKLRAIKKIGGQLVMEDVSLVVVENNDGTPIAVACETGAQGFQCVAHAKDPDFNRILRSLGIDRMVFCESVDKLLKPDSQLPVIVSR